MAVRRRFSPRTTLSTGITACARCGLSGRWTGKEALELLKHVVAVRERMLAEEHPHRLVSQHALAGAYRADGQVKKAVELLEHVVAVRERMLAEEHPHRLVSQQELAGWQRSTLIDSHHSMRLPGHTKPMGR